MGDIENRIQKSKPEFNILRVEIVARLNIAGGGTCPPIGSKPSLPRITKLSRGGADPLF